ncbi:MULTISPECIES: DUF982 domain-containing protein [Mesorhizobium]|uniref:DUF982 domain-containing protein n=1 Tax=Mesorhizobium sp. TaxID=1871066 RepID=UPI000AD8F15F|nr:MULTISPECIES: DUF982 domain-containing protein [Mesorhizobium]
MVHPPVYIETHRPGLTYGYNNVEGAAAEFMKWTKRGPKLKKAVNACMACLEGEGTADDARKAFEAATGEQRLLRSST